MTAGAEIDDAEAIVPECDTAFVVDISSCIVWAAVSDRVQHSEQIVCPKPLRIWDKPPTDATHVLLLDRIR